VGPLRSALLAASLAGVAAGIAPVTPAAAHLLVRGAPLSEWAATSPTAVVARVEGEAADAEGRGVALRVEQAVIGELPRGPLRVALAGHHPPDYATGARVLVFLDGDAPPWRSRQSALDVVEVPDDTGSRQALIEAVRAYAGLRRVPDRDARLAQLETLALRNLASKSERVRREALLDLMAIVPAATFDASDVVAVAALARSGAAASSIAPGLVVLLAAIRLPEAERSLLSLMEDAPDPRVRARAARVVGRRRGAEAVPALRRALADPAPGVRLTAQRELDRIARAAASGPAHPPAPRNPREGTNDAETHPAEAG